MSNAVRALSMLALVGAGCSPQPVAATSEAIIDVGGLGTIGGVTLAPSFGGNFTVHALGRMCLDFGGQAYWTPGAPLMLYWCNGTIAQQFNVQEVPGGGHDVTLHLGNGDNNYCIGAHGGVAAAGAALEIQVCDGSDAQRFALDGDSIMAGWRLEFAQAIARRFVATPKGDVTNARTQIVLGPRQLTENEYFRFVATDGSNRKPHSGFVTPPTSGFELKNTLAAASWGTVVEVPDSPVIHTLNGTLDANIPDGVTLRGDRKFTNNGPLITEDFNEKGALFDIAASDVRVTGLRISGVVWGTDKPVLLSGINVRDNGYSNVTIDHNEIATFTSNGVAVTGTRGPGTACGGIDLPQQPRPMPVRITGNFIHHIIGDGQGYGVVTAGGAFPLVDHNTAYQNRHTVAGAHDDFTSGYFATDNFILAQAPIYNGYDHVSNFDFHGTDNLLCHDHWGGYAGDYVVIAYNTFLTNDRENVLIRGQSCRRGTVDGNVFGQQKDFTQVMVGVPPPFCSPRLAISGGAVVNIGIDGLAESNPPMLDVTTNNAYSQPAPVNELAIGDFDGDGIDDIFTTTGTGWFYSSGGVSEWRWLRRATEKVGALRVGDLDGDGRADVIRVNGATLDVSWGGVSQWMTLTKTPAAIPITSYAIGNFDGDRLHGDDIFATDGATWWVAKNGRNFAPTQTSTKPASALRFGDFDGDGKTDVFAIDGGHWSYSSAAVGTWTAMIGSPSTSNVNGFVTGDFDGDGRTDIGRYYIGGIDLGTNQPIWKFDYSPNARAAFTNARTTNTPAAWSGHFALGSGIIWWDGNEFDFATGSAPTARLSRQHMQ